MRVLENERLMFFPLFHACMCIDSFEILTLTLFIHQGSYLRQDVRLLGRWVSHGGADHGAAVDDEAGGFRLQDSIRFEKWPKVRVDLYRSSLGQDCLNLFYL